MQLLVAPKLFGVKADIAFSSNTASSLPKQDWVQTWTAHPESLGLLDPLVGKVRLYCSPQDRSMKERLVVGAKK